MALQPAKLAAVAFAAAARGAAAAVLRDVLAGAPFNLNSGDESDVAVTRFTDTTGIACYLGPEIQGHGQRGRCNLVEDGAIVGDTLVQLSDKTLHSTMAPLTDETSIWCYADSENSYELKCRKVNRDGNVLSVEPSGELSIKRNSVNALGSSVLSAARFSDGTAVMCADNPGVQAANPDPTGPLQCALLFIKPANDTWCQSCLGVNSNSGIISLDTGSILTMSVISFGKSSGAVCYTSAVEGGGNRVSCTELALSGSQESDSTLTFGETVVISADGVGAAATALSADKGIVCYVEGAATLCSPLELSGSMLSKGQELQVFPAPAAGLDLEAFSNETVVACFHAVGGEAACYAMNTEDGTWGDALMLDDVDPAQEFALTSMTETAGLLCYRSTSGRGVCRDLQVLPKTTTTFATETVTATTVTGTETSGTETSVSMSETSVTTVSTTPHTITETSLSTTPHTTTETSVTIPAEVALSGASPAANAAGWVALAVLCLWA